MIKKTRLFIAVAGEMFDTLTPERGAFSRVALSNRCLFGLVVQKQLERAATTA